MVAKKAAATRTRPARSKTETRAAFEEIQQSAASAESLDRTSGEVVKAERTRVASAVGNITVEGVVVKVANLGLELSRSLALVQEQLIAETKQLEDIRAAIRFAEEDLKNLHNLDVAATSIENLLTDYREKEKALEDKIKAKEADWAEAQKIHEKSKQEADLQLKKDRAREQADYDYRMATERRTTEGEFALKVEKLTKEQADKQEALEKGWAAREDAIGKQEKDIEALRTQVAAFPEQLTKEVDKSVKIATSSLKQTLEHAHALATKDLETKLTIADAKLAQADADKATLAAQIVALTSKLDAAQRQVVEVATKAVDGASGNLAMVKMQETIATTSNGGNGRKQ